MDSNRRSFLHGVGGIAIPATAWRGISTQTDLHVTVDEPTDVKGTSATLNGTLEDTGGATEVEVALKYRRKGSHDLSDWTAVGRQTLTIPGEFTGEVTGLDPDTEYEIHAIANANDGDSDVSDHPTFTTASSVEKLYVTVDEPTDVKGTSATLNGTLENLDGANEAEVMLKYRRKGSNDLSDWTAVGRQTLTSTGSFTGEVEGLDTDTEYEIHAVANASDGDSHASDHPTFTTASSVMRPTVSINQPTDVNATSATLNGTLEDLGSADETEVALKYRLSSSRDVSDYTAVGRQTLSSTGSFTGEVTGLDSGTEYEIHAIANASGYDTYDSPHSTFTTNASSGGQAFEYTDGFADAAWFDDSVDVYRIQNPDVSELENALTASGPRVVVFETSGTIDLGEGRLSIENDKCWIAGQTAPSPGITLIRGDLWVNANDCVIQHLRVRPGDAGNDSGWEPDTIRTADGTNNNIIDHCSATWSVDENISPGYDAVDTTISNCIIGEALNNASHSKGEHSMGVLVGDRSTNNAIFGNVFAHNKRRNPRLKDDSETVVANNLMYNFESGTAMGSHGAAAIEGNGYLSPNSEHNITGGQQDDNVPDAYLADNYTDGNNQMTNGQLNRLDSRPFWPSGLEVIPAGDVEQHNTTYAGARPADRTEHDTRIIDLISNRNGTYIDSQSEVGGYPSLAENTHNLDVPDSDLRSWLEQWAQTVEEG